MATPTPTTWTEWNGSNGLLYWHVAWGGLDVDDFGDSVLVDISALANPPASVKVLSVKWKVNGDYSAALEFDATTDQLIYEIANQTNSTLIDETDFSGGPNGGRSPDPSAAGFVGDIILTTTGVDTDDELTLEVEFVKKT